MTYGWCGLSITYGCMVWPVCNIRSVWPVYNKYPCGLSITYGRCGLSIILWSKKKKQKKKIVSAGTVKAKDITTKRLEERGLKTKNRSATFLERTRKDYRQSDEQWNCSMTRKDDRQSNEHWNCSKDKKGLSSVRRTLELFKGRERTIVSRANNGTVQRTRKDYRQSGEQWNCSKDEKGLSSVRRTLEMFQRQRWQNI